MEKESTAILQVHFSNHRLSIRACTEIDETRPIEISSADSLTDYPGKIKIEIEMNACLRRAQLLSICCEHRTKQGEQNWDSTCEALKRNHLILQFDEEVSSLFFYFPNVYWRRGPVPANSIHRNRPPIGATICPKRIWIRRPILFHHMSVPCSNGALLALTRKIHLVIHNSACQHPHLS